MSELPAEIEAKFFCDKAMIQEKLQQLGAKLIKPECMMHRKHFDTPDKKLHQIGGWIRLRDEGNKITLAYKQLESHSIGGMKEVEIIVDNFHNAQFFLESIGFVFTTSHENLRESWLLGDVKVDIDTWPWLPPLVEVESLSEEKLWSVVTALGLKRELALFGGIEIAYMSHYNLTREQFFMLDDITFGPLPAVLAN